MKKLFARNKVHYAAFVYALFLFSGCATNVIDTENAGADSDVKARAMARWDVLLNGDLAGAYEYLSPGYRSSVSLVQYQRSILLKKVKWTSAEFIESDCEENTCNVKIMLGFTVYGALPGMRTFDDTQDIEESWVRVKGQWYFVPPK